MKLVVDLKNESMNWADFLHADTNLSKLKFTLMITEWVGQKRAGP